MFTVDPAITDLNLKEKDLVKVFFSMNVHHVAAPDMSLQEARSFVFFFREGRDRLSSHIGLHFLHADRKLFYTYSGNPFPDNQLAEVEVESRNFAEDLGAMLDEIDFTKMSGSEKNRWIDEQEILTGRKKQPANTEAPPEASSGALPAAGANDDQAEAAPTAPVHQAAEAAAPYAASPLPDADSAVREQTLSPAAPAPSLRPAVKDATPPRGTPAQTGPVPQAPVKKQSRAQAKTVFPAAARQTDAPPDPGVESASPPARTDDVLEQAMKSGIVKAPKAQLRKDIRTASGVVSRDKEALARLLSSF